MRRFNRHLLDDAIFQFGKEIVTTGFFRRNRMGIAKADMQRRRARDTLQRPVDRLDSIFPGFVRARLHVGLIKLHDIGTRCIQRLYFLVYRGGIIHRR